MLINVCRCKLHGCTLTHKLLHYEGSIGLSRELVDAVGLYAHERVQVLNLANGTRLETYVIVEEKDLGKVALYGPAARLGEIGDSVIVLAYAWIEEKDAEKHGIRTCRVDSQNRPLAMHSRD